MSRKESAIPVFPRKWRKTCIKCLTSKPAGSCAKLSFTVLWPFLSFTVSFILLNCDLLISHNSSIVTLCYLSVIEKGHNVILNVIYNSKFCLFVVRNPFQLHEQSYKKIGSTNGRATFFCFRVPSDNFQVSDVKMCVGEWHFKYTFILFESITVWYAKINILFLGFH